MVSEVKIAGSHTLIVFMSLVMLVGCDLVTGLNGRNAIKATDQGGAGQGGAGLGGGTVTATSSSSGGAGGGGDYDVPDAVLPAYEFTVTQNGPDLGVAGRAFFRLVVDGGSAATLLCQEQWDFVAKMTLPAAAECPGGDCTGLCPGEAGAQQPPSDCVGSFTGIVPAVPSYASDCNYEMAEAWMHPNNMSAVNLLGRFLHSAPFEADLFIAGDNQNGSWGAFADDNKQGDQAGWFNGMSVSYAVKQNGMWDVNGAQLFAVTLQEIAPTDTSGLGRHLMAPAFRLDFPLP